MLATQAINNQSDVTVYTCPTGKKAMIFVDAFPISQAPSFTLKINNYIYYTDTLVELISVKLSLTEGDTIKVSSDGQVNVFVHGLEM